jgi:hypothetical protein
MPNWAWKKKKKKKKGWVSFHIPSQQIGMDLVSSRITVEFCIFRGKLWIVLLFGTGE